MRFGMILLAVAFAVSTTFALDAIPVYGPARVGVEDADLLEDTVLEPGVLAVTPGTPYRVVIGDGLTPGGIEIHPEGCVRDFADVSVATTNLDMRTYAVTFGPWKLGCVSSATPAKPTCATTSP